MEKPVFQTGFWKEWAYDCPLNLEDYECGGEDEDSFFETENQAWEAFEDHIDRWHNRMESVNY